MSDIYVEVNDQALKITNTPLIASGGVNEDRVFFTFSEEWNGFAKSGVFYQDKEHVYYSLIDPVTNSCVVPKEAMFDPGRMFFGVFGTSGNVIRTSEVVRYEIENGALSSDLAPDDPTPDIYAQILAACQAILDDQATFENNTRDEIEQFQADWEENVESVINEAQTNGEMAYSLATSLQLEYTDMDGGIPSTTNYENDIDGGGVT